eukprot:14293995-Alexandrium_andersonii.AAC.1
MEWAIWNADVGLRAAPHGGRASEGGNSDAGRTANKTTSARSHWPARCRRILEGELLPEGQAPREKEA